MKRYRVVQFDFDSRAMDLTAQDSGGWDETAKELHKRRVQQTREELIFEYGASRHETKIGNFADLGAKPFSILAFHNRFLEEARTAFVSCAYYPCLTAVCALGERILNHLILLLRDDFKDTEEYRKIYRKDSFDNWALAIDTLAAWNVLLPDVVTSYGELKEMRNAAIHFRPDIDTNARELALQAFRCLTRIIEGQFSITTQPWILITLGEIYIKKDWEENPFVKKVYLPNCVYVGPLNRVVEMQSKIRIKDSPLYKDVQISDDQFKAFNISRKVPDEFMNLEAPSEKKGLA